MTTDLAFDFTVDKTNHTVYIIREFAAELPLVWDAFTKQELLDQWGAPEPWVIKTKDMNFEVGGRRLYSMTSPEGQEHWSIQQFTSISPIKNFKMRTNFSDKDGNVNPAFQSSEQNLHFTEADGITTVNITIQYGSLAILEMMIEKGFREGFTMTMKNLEKLLTTILKK
jgi:uncharacterized protein YndB with AHSA1/START domain